MTNLDFLPYARQSISAEDITQVAEALSSQMITRGPEVEAFEKAFAEYCGARYAVFLSNGTSALKAAYFAAEVGPQDRFITTPNTFIATAGAAMERKASPIFVDIERETGNLDLDQVQHNINKPQSRGKTVIVPVHFSGIPVDMQRLDRMIAGPNTVVIEDAAHAIGSSYQDEQKVGCCSWSQMTVFSLHPVKNMTTGEGGIVTTNDQALWERLKTFRNNGIVYSEKEEEPWYYEVKDISGNYHATSFQAALGLSQLKRLDAFAQKRQELVAQYREELRDVPQVRLFTSAYDCHTAFHLFVVQIDFERLGKRRGEVMHQLHEKGIGTQVHYIPLYRHPIFKSDDLRAYFPHMEEYYSQALSLPLYYDLSSEDVSRVVQALKSLAIG